MPLETYTVAYIADASAFTTGARQVEAAVLAVDQAVVTSKKNMTGMFGGAARSATNAAAKISDLNNALNGLPTAAAAAKSSLQGLTTAANNAKKSTDAFAAATDGWITKATATRVAWMAAAEALRIYSKAAEDAKKHLNEGAEKGLTMRDKAREYANLLGKNEVDDETMTRLFQLSQAGGMAYDESLKYGEQFLGSITAGRDKGHITPQQEGILEREGEAFTSRLGLDAATGGDLVAIIPQSVDMTKDERGKPLTTEQGIDKAMGQLGAMTGGLADGRGKITTLARSELAAASSALPAGHVADHAEMGAFARVASTFSKTASGSGTAFKQMDRLVNENLGEGGEFLKSIGVADQKGDRNKLGKLKEHVDAQRKAAADPSKFDAKGYLQQKGFHADGELDSTVAYLDNMDMLDESIRRGRIAAKDGKGVRAKNRQFMASQTGQARQAKAIQEAGNYEQTRKRQRLAAARKAAYGQLQAEHKIDTTGTNLVDGFLDGTVNMIQPNTGHEARIDDRVWENQRQAAQQAGIEDKVRQTDFRFLESREQGSDRARHVEARYGGQNPAQLDRFLNLFGPEIESKGIATNGAAVDVGTNARDQGTVPAQQRAQPPAGAAGVAGANGAAGAGAAVGGGAAAGVGKVASVDSSALDKTAEKLGKAVDTWLTAMQRLRSTPGDHLGGSVSPYRA